MISEKKYRMLALFVITALLISSLASCGPAATEEVTDEPGPIEPTSTEAPPEPEDTPVPEPEEETSIVILLPDDPPNFNGNLIFSGYDRIAQEMVMLSLTELDPQGNVYPELAAELPSVENGAVVIDEDAWTMDVTWKLRDDVYWEDGEPVTADDVAFTWNAAMDPETGIWTPGADYTDSIEVIDDYTFVIHYNSVYPAHLYQMSMAHGFTIWPEHYCDAEQGYSYWDCHMDPLANGPYLLEEWEFGDHLTFVRNPNYFEEGKPYIDKVYFQIVPEESVQKTMMAEGVADVNFWAREDFAIELGELEFIDVSATPVTRWLMQLWINLAARGTFDPEGSPHPVFGDVRVRQAMRIAIDVDSIVEGIYPSGDFHNVWTQFFRPPYDICGTPKPVVDPEAAKVLLEEAGWTDKDGDGVRECHGCATGAPEGYPMAFDFIVWSEGGEDYARTGQLIAEDLQAIGMDPNLSLETGAVLWDLDGLELTGNFDMNMWDDGYPGTDPSDYLWVYYASSAVPNAELEGWNIGYWMNEEFDALLDESYTLDEEYRKELFCQMDEIMQAEMPTIPLYDYAELTIYNNRIEGIESTINAMVNWNIADWKIVK
jgi:peptide/nickel transport system substrate-binding protein